MPNHSYGDQPARRDELGFAPSVEALRDVILTADMEDTPLTVGVYGAWGSGKTSFMRMLQDRLDPQDPDARTLPIWFDAWRYNQEDALWRALLLGVIEGLRATMLDSEARMRALMSGDGRSPTKEEIERAHRQVEQDLDDMAASLYRNIERERPGELEIDWPAAGQAATRLVVLAGFAFVPMLAPLAKIVEAAQGKIGEGEDLADLWKVFHRERTKIYREQVRAIEQFQNQLRSLVGEWISGRGWRLVVFIDDLDRCLPEQAVGVLEAIKVFLDIPGCIFVLGMDRQIIERGIRVRYKEFALDADAAARAGHAAAVFPVAGRDYLEKIVQVPFELPPLEGRMIEKFLRERLRLADETDTLQVVSAMTAGLERNPRKLKRTLNTFRLQLALAKANGQKHPAALYAKLVVLQSSFADLYEQVAAKPTLLQELERHARGLGGSSTPPELRDALAARPPLKAMFYQEPFFERLGADDLSRLVYQTRATQDG